VKQATAYLRLGPVSLSVLTEQDNFAGSLGDLVAVKRAHPETPVLRKDFLLSKEDIDVSFRAGADAVLLIASILTAELLEELYRETERHALTALVEVHDREDIDRVRPIRPRVVGINSRNLRTFRVDLLDPLNLAREIDWPCVLVFESGLFHAEDARLARDGGFGALLVGEAVMNVPGRIDSFLRVMNETAPRAPGRDAFWSRIAAARAQRDRPLAKICGITNVRDARLARDLGADVLGLIYARSPRTAPHRLAAELSSVIDAPLVGVVVEADEGGETAAVNREYVRRAQSDLRAGYLSALQLHGGASPSDAAAYGTPYYKAIRAESVDHTIESLRSYRSARVLIDAYDRERSGGTGRRVDDEIVRATIDALASSPHGELWLAGGIGPDSIAQIVDEYRPELVDASSRLESEPGIKDRRLLRRFFAELERVPVKGGHR
jgi:indole-3-glycerol phosphate synthase/phosphoribosylanthranilate isomerase